MERVEIAYNHLLNWVCARGSLPNDYAIKLLNVEEYCRSNLLNDDKFPEPVKAVFHRNTEEYSEWYESLRKAFDLLKESEEGGKMNFIGQYTFEPMQKVNKALKNYNKHNLHIASYYQLLYKYVTYYLPHLRKSVARVTSELNDYKVKEAESSRKLDKLSRDLQAKLDQYGLKAADYPFMEENHTLLFFNLQEKVLSSAVDYLGETYREVVGILSRVHEPLLQLVSQFVKYQSMEGWYDLPESTRFFTHCAKYGLDSHKLADSLLVDSSNNNSSTNQNNDGDADKAFLSPNNDSLSDQLVLNSFLANNRCRQALLADLNELLIFIRMRKEVKSRGAPNNLNILTSSQPLEDDLKDYLLFEQELEKVVNLLMCPRTALMGKVVTSEERLALLVSDEMGPWSMALKEVNKQLLFNKQVRELETRLRSLKNELDLVRDRVKGLKERLEEEVFKLVKVQINLFGDNITTISV